MKNKKLLFWQYCIALLIDQFLAVLATIIITSFAAFIFPNGNGFISLVISFVIYVLIIYSDSWHKGVEDINRIKLGFIKKNTFKGVLAGIFAIIPTIAFAFPAFFAETQNIVKFDFLGIDAFTAINRLWNLPLALFFSFADNKPIFNFVIPFIMPIISGIGYLFGLNRISIKQYFIYKSDEK